MAQELSSPVAAWTPSPDLRTHELLSAINRSKQPGDAAGAAARAATGANKRSQIAPFRERSTASAQPAISSQGGSGAPSSSKNVLQPPMSHKANSKPRPSMPPQQFKAASFSSSKASVTSNGSKVAGATQLQQAATDSRGRSSNSSTRPASRHAAATVAAAEAAVSAAAAALKVGGMEQAAAQQSDNEAVPAAAPAHQWQHDRLVQQQHQLQQRTKKVPGSRSQSGLDAAGLLISSNGASSSHQWPGGAAGADSLSDYLLLEPLRVHGLPPRPGAVPKIATSQHTPSDTWNNGAAVPANWRHTVDVTAEANSGMCDPATAQQMAASQAAAAPGAGQHQQLLQYSQQSAAEMLAAQARSRRLRIQSRSLQGPPAFHRSPVPRPDSPPAVVLDGALLLASCTGASCPRDVTVVDLSSSHIRSVALPNTTPAAEPVEQLGVQGNVVAAAAAQSPGLNEFEQLCSLDLSDNQLGCIAGLAWLPGLWQLAVSANKLQGLQGLAQVLASSSSDAPMQPKTHKPEAAAMQGEQGGGTSAGEQQQQKPGQIQQQMPPSAPSSRRASQVSTPGETGLTELAAANKQHCSIPLQSILRCPDGFGCLQVLDVSYNKIPADQLLGPESPLNCLPRLSELHAVGNSLFSLPAVLGPFTSLTYLDLTHNRLRANALLPLGQLPVLQHLLLAQNPVKKVPDALTATASDAGGILQARVGGSSVNSTGDTVQAVARGEAAAAAAATAAATGDGLGWAHGGRFGHLSHLDLRDTNVSAAQQLLPLLLLPRLAVLELAGTPLATRCWSSRAPIQELQKPGLSIITHQEEPLGLWMHNSKGQPTQHARQQHKRQQQADAGSNDSRSSSSSPGRLLPVTVSAAAEPSHILAAAGKSSILGMRHELLVAAFERVEQGIDNLQLAPVAEEDSSAWQEQESQVELPGTGTVGAWGGAQGKRSGEGQQEVPIVDQTFITGVGITGELPGEDDDGEQAAAAAAVAPPDKFEDPTERIAVALGLQVTQLAHYTHRHPGNPAGAIHRLRHALAHPLVDPDAGQRPDQHHASMTAAVAAKQRPRQLLPLPQPIPTALDTRVVVVQGIDNMLQDMRGRLQALEGTLLQQLQAQANKLSVTAQALSKSAATEAANLLVPSVTAQQHADTDVARERSSLDSCKLTAGCEPSSADSEATH